MSVLLRKKYESIKKDKLSESGKALLKSMAAATNNFKDAKASAKIKTKFLAFFDKLKTSKPEAIKGLTAPKEPSNAKQFKEARERRSGQSGVPQRESDIEKDAGRPAISVKGKRVTDGKHYPYIKGNVYYEYRDNRFDKRPKKYPKLEDGGMMAKGGETKDLEKVIEKVDNFLNPLGYSAKVEKSIGDVLYIVEPSTRKVGKNRSDFFDGMQILAFQDGTFEVSEYQAGENEDELYIYKETKSLTLALKDLVKGNKRKPIKKYADGGVIDANAFDSLKKGDKIKISYGDSIAKSNEKELLVKSKNLVGKGKSWESEKITFTNMANPTGVNYFAYKRKNGYVGFAFGDMAITNVKLLDKFEDGGEMADGGMITKENLNVGDTIQAKGENWGTFRVKSLYNQNPHIWVIEGRGGSRNLGEGELKFWEFSNKMADGGGIDRYNLSFNYNPDIVKTENIKKIVSKYTKDWRHNNDLSEVSFYVLRLTKEQASELKSELKMEDVYDIEVDKSRYADGGEMAMGGEPHRIDEIFADGGTIAQGNNEMLESQLKAVEHHAKELSSIVNKDTEVEAWVVGKIERAATDLSDITHYLDGRKFAHGGSVDEDIKIGDKFKTPNEYTYTVDEFIGDDEVMLRSMFGAGYQVFKIDNLKRYLQSGRWKRVGEDGGKFADGGSVKSGGFKKSTYVPNRDIESLTLTLKGELKTIKGSNIWDGVYVKSNTSTAKKGKGDAKSIYDKIMADAPKINAYEKTDSDVVKIQDIEKLLSVGYNEEQIRTIYLGYSFDHKIICDNEFEGYDSIFSNQKEYVEKIINQMIENKTNNEFSIGLKYPDFNWGSIITKYKISLEPKTVSKKIDYKDGDVDEYVYQIFVGDKIVIGQSKERVRIKKGKYEETIKEDGVVSNPKVKNKYQVQRDLKAGFNGGYWGIVSSDINVIDDIAKMLTSQSSECYLKDLAMYRNNLGGVGATELKESKIKFAHGGHTQGYDDREDERLSMEHGKISGKDFIGSHKQREHSRRDDARFEERMAKGGKLIGKQKNIDVNKNGKLDAEDFKLLRQKAKSRLKK
jgi:hypothetical protein